MLCLPSRVLPNPDRRSEYVGSCLDIGIQFSEPYLLEVETASIFSSSVAGVHATDFSAV
ncbi:hypothetical protein MtrunA17_Chr8g0385801 [Medicago truncatula]|uniref:Uncharacterized protein n=1 Tax=Medicago truncatula TaxID=3880 RepID=A0A396GRV3_MEDTR|nr:hypothetical protein MtrunA17_Chr8g0385801 [Medicago truncatula]